ncbi:FecR family protein [Methylophaga sp. UBA678]|uniref:FecR domain-containing protein n=1 Tax=Methylophaga sp. UBA678 TaxID=1946901 RepID=UPI0023B3F77E|nr:FecR family protein [Methylophaga sp. UBA678]
MNNSDGPPNKIITEAADWLIRKQESPLTQQEQEQFDSWHDQSQDHQKAWRMAQSLSQSFQSVPSHLGNIVLKRSQKDRRQLIKLLSGLLVVPATGVIAYKTFPVSRWSADLSTATGQQITQLLADGSRVTMNTQTAVNILFDDHLRRVHLISGQIQISTVKDPLSRPFIVTTQFGQVEALGTVFQLNQLSDGIAVSVQQDTVEVTTLSGEKQLLKAGQQLVFSQQNISQPKQSNAADSAWVDGQLIVDDEKLSLVIHEISRYRTGWLRCSPEVANLKVSGVFQLHDTDKVLQNLANTLPIRLVYRTPYWVTVDKRN